MVVFLWGCGDQQPDTDVAGIDLALDFRRTDSLMYACATALQGPQPPTVYEAFETYLRPDRDYWYQWLGVDQAMPGASPQRADSLLAVQLGTLLREPGVLQVLDSIRRVFPYNYPFAERLAPPLKRLVRAFPDIALPAIRTHANGYDPSGDPRSVDQLMPMPDYFSLGLHYFLGENFSFYPPNLPGYIRRRYDPAFVEVEMMHEIAEGMVAPLDLSRQPTLLDHMIRVGIKQYFVHQMLPYTPDSMRLRYTSKQMAWADYYEDRIYKELLEQLFDTDYTLIRDYLSDKPYTTTLSSESAPRIGEYTGWKIVDAYMRRNSEVTLADLCARNDYQAIFQASRYKP
ncbi:MAG: hypothetical protein OHK0039_32600 [Bacteroidia bacterium]